VKVIKSESLKRSQQPLTVLVVDDDPSTLRSLKRLLIAAGFEVKAFDRPSALLACPVPRSNACIIADINLPEMNGVEMCATLNRTSRGLPTILITGESDARVRSLIADSDAVAVLFKPFDEQPLLDAIARALTLSI
jgi:FixJ family two-component response regulator